MLFLILSFRSTWLHELLSALQGQLGDADKRAMADLLAALARLKAERERLEALKRCVRLTEDASSQHTHHLACERPNDVLLRLGRCLAGRLAL